MRLALVAQAAINAMAHNLLAAISASVYIAEQSTVIAVPIRNADIGHRSATVRTQPAITFRDLRTVILNKDEPPPAGSDKGNV